MDSSSSSSVSCWLTNPIVTTTINADPERHKGLESHSFKLRRQFVTTRLFIVVVIVILYLPQLIPTIVVASIEPLDRNFVDKRQSFDSESEASLKLYFRLKQSELNDDKNDDDAEKEPESTLHENLDTILTQTQVKNSKILEVIEQVLSKMLNNGNYSSMRFPKPIINAVLTTSAFVSNSRDSSYNISPTFSYSFEEDFFSSTTQFPTAFVPLIIPQHHHNNNNSNNNNNNNNNNLGDDGRLSNADEHQKLTFSALLIIIIGILFAFATTVGNLMVMISIRLDKQLQTISNYFLFSLAVADITIGLISIPLMTYYTAMQYWGIGYAACQFWLSVDYLMSNASVLNLLLISFDRYFSVTRPLTYRPRRTKKKTLVMIACSYILSVLLWPPWIIGWPYIEGKFTVEAGSCVVQFLALSENSWASQLATIGTAVAAFYLPVSIMIILYYQVFRETKRRQEEFRKLQAGQMFSPTQYGANSALQFLMIPLIRGMALRANSIPATGFFPQNPAAASSLNAANANTSTAILTKQLLNFSSNNPNQPPPIPLKRSRSGRFSWMKYCVGGRSNTAEISSEESSEVVIQALDDTTSVTSSVYIAQQNSLRKVKRAASQKDSNAHEVRHSNNRVNSTSNNNNNNAIIQTTTYRSRNVNSEITPTSSIIPQTIPPSNNHEEKAPLRSYKVLIEYHNEAGKRPSVRLSNENILGNKICLQNGAAIGVTKEEDDDAAAAAAAEEDADDKSLNKKKRYSGSLNLPKNASNSTPLSSNENAIAGVTAFAAAAIAQNGKTKNAIAALKEEQLRKSEKERRKNERKQESKAAKTLSAILFAFIVTWTPYNVIVCWEAFFPHSIPNILFTISYFLCYVNSTINPLCYALCNARFRMTYMRILRCKQWRKFDKATLYNHAYIRRP